jgi:predicted mannosyl-3-phosphoglycerate phosphatase (HAD superfamily)
MKTTRTTEAVEMSAGERAALDERIVRYMHNAPRTWHEMVSALAGVSDACDVGTSGPEWLKVQRVSIALGDLLRAGKVTRECDTDPRFDIYRPA